MITIENKLKACSPFWGRVRHRKITGISSITIHRVETVEMSEKLGVTLPRDIVGVAMGDFRIPEVGSLAYPLIVMPDGKIQQGRPLSHVTPHARVANYSGCAVGIFGNMNNARAPIEQWNAAVELVAELVKYLSIPVMDVMGHDEIRGGSNDLEKKCPGVLWSMQDFRQAVLQHNRIAGEQTLVHAGLVLTDENAPFA